MRSVARQANAIPVVLKSTRAALRTLVLNLLNAGEEVEEVLLAADARPEFAVYASTVLQWSEHAGSGGLTPEALHRFEYHRNEVNQARIEATSQRDISRATHRDIRPGNEARDQRWNVLLDAYREQARAYRVRTGEAYEHGKSLRAGEVDSLVEQLRGILADEAVERYPVWNPQEKPPTEGDDAPRAPNEFARLDPVYLDEEEDFFNYFEDEEP